MSKEESLGRSYFIILGFMVISGTFNTVFTKLQNSSYDLILGAKFNHPWFQSLIMFIGEFYCAIIWFFAKNYFKRKEEEEKQRKIALNPKGSFTTKPELPEVSPYIFLIPCLCDVIGTTLLNFALLYLVGSIFQMLRGGIIIVTCIFLVIFLKKNPKNYQWLGVGIVFIGIFIVGVSTVLDKGKGNQTGKEKETTSTLGIVLLLCSLLFQGFQFIYEEKILLEYKVHPMQLVAWEGTWGILIFAVILPIFQFIPCNFDKKEKICSGNSSNEFYLENSGFAIKQCLDKIPILFYVIGQTFSIAGFNFFGIMLVKYSSAASRAVMDSARTFFVWIFFLLVPMANGETLEHFLWLELVGFIIMVFGQIIYNGIIKIPFLGFDKHFKLQEIEQAKRKESEPMIINDEEENVDVEEEKDILEHVDLRRSSFHT